MYSIEVKDPRRLREGSGPSPRLEGSWHAVVWKDGAPLFDPHPSRSFLQGEPGEFELVVRIRPFEKAAA